MESGENTRKRPWHPSPEATIRRKTMNRKLLLVVMTGILVLTAVPAMAQISPTGAMPKVIWLYHENVKPAMTSAHEKVEQGFAKYWAKANVQPFLALDSLSSGREVLFISGYESFGAFETDYQVFKTAGEKPGQADLTALEKQEAGLISALQSKIAVLRDDLSYLPDRFMQEMPKSRYFEIVTLQVGPGKDEDFATVAKFYRSAYEKGGYEQPFGIYQVYFGGSGSSYLIFIPMKSLKSLDEMMTRQPALLKAMGEEEHKRIKMTAQGALVSQQANLYSFNPKMSHVSAEFAAADPSFWTPMTRTTATSPAIRTTNPNERKKDQKENKR